MRLVSRYALGLGAVSALLTACGGPQPPIGAPGALPQTPALAVRNDSTNYKVVYSFRAGSDGANPVAGLVDVGGTLYGTTIGGGGHSCSYTAYAGCGTVFRVTPRGTEKVLHSFGAGNDGQNPRAGLVSVGGTLYGTTRTGGSGVCEYYTYEQGCGTVFSVTPSGAEKVLHNFAGLTDGEQPYAGLINVKGTLYGTTSQGGYGSSSGCFSGDYNQGCGTVFSITPDGTESVIYNFGDADSPVGSAPLAPVIELNGKLYGTTVVGGTYTCAYKEGCGTVFSVTPDGKEKVLHSFGAGSDGRYPYAGLIVVSGKLYGTTGCSEYEGRRHVCGTAFSITPDGKEKVLHTFGGDDGNLPSASLIELNGKLYGTTQMGGAHNGGTVFSMTTSGTEKVLHSFGGNADGMYPYSGLIDVNGTLYGTTEAGGAHGDGTVFSVKP